MSDVRTETLLGNLVLARGLVEAGCQVACSYPGTPSSEILPGVVRFAKEEGLNIYTEWSVNEKVAFDNALAASWAGKRSATIMKQVGLNVAADSLLSAAYTGVLGGMVIVSADDPGPHSSQTEQDTRWMAHFAKVPVFDPSDPDEGREMIAAAYELSERHRVPVILRPAIRVCHAIQSIEFREVDGNYPAANFPRDQERWAATPRFRQVLHQELNDKLEALAAELGELRPFNRIENLPAGEAPRERAPLGVIAGGVPYANLVEWLGEQGLRERVPVLKLGVPFPFPGDLAADFVERFDRVLVLEEPDALIETLLPDRTRVVGRLSGHVPDWGELTPERQAEVVAPVLLEAGVPVEIAPRTAAETAMQSLELPVRPPTLCPGCPHRSAFHAIRKVFKGRKSIYTSDIGCYTLGTNLDAVDTCLDMGAGITMASGFAQAYALDGTHQPVVATMGDSTFFHSGATGLLNAVYNRARMVLVLLDNDITAMTGMQPTPGTGGLANGEQGHKIPLERLVSGCGVDFIEIVDPYDHEEFTDVLKRADGYVRGDEGTVAVIIARHPCVLYDRQGPIAHLDVDQEACNGCYLCVTHFECPAIVPQNQDAERKKDRFVTIDRSLCIDCGTCAPACPRGAFVRVEGS
ncbi:MAG: thiamine pyrophosphate-dependent enzyme [Myxococcota bacterium]|jgi:indolepyruvate ferredoxin oxidoreductase alpha subunit|nr:thiamine pyrophosphate-dependent enzyme [Myxococcota bacterium]